MADLLEKSIAGLEDALPDGLVFISIDEASYDGEQFGLARLLILTVTSYVVFRGVLRHVA